MDIIFTQYAAMGMSGNVMAFHTIIGDNMIDITPWNRNKFTIMTGDGTHHPLIRG